MVTIGLILAFQTKYGPLCKNLLLGTLCAISGAGLSAAFYACSIKRAPDYMITNAGKVPDAAAADQHNRVLLQIMSFARNDGVSFNTACEPDPCDFTQSRIGLFRSLCDDLKAHAPPLGILLQNGSLAFLRFLISSVTDHLINRRHSL